MLFLPRDLCRNEETEDENRKQSKPRKSRPRLKRPVTDEDIIADDIDTTLAPSDDIIDQLGIDIDAVKAIDSESKFDMHAGNELKIGSDAEIDVKNVKTGEEDIKLADELGSEIPSTSEPSNGIDELVDELDFSDVAEDKAEKGSCTLYLNKITVEKKEEAVNLIMSIGGIAESEATKLSGRLVIPVLKDVTEEKAEEALNAFKKAGLSGRIRKIKPN